MIELASSKAEKIFLTADLLRFLLQKNRVNLFICIILSSKFTFNGFHSNYRNLNRSL